MAGSSNFLVFDENNLNVEDDATYSTDNTRQNGVSNGPASVDLHNKLYRQVTVMVSAIGQFMANQGLTVNDISLTNLVTAITQSFVSPGINNQSTQQVYSVPVPIDTRTVNIARTSGQITSITLTDPTQSNTVIETITLNRTSGQISSIVDAVGGKTLTYTLNRTSGLITSITKAVS